MIEPLFEQRLLVCPLPGHCAEQYLKIVKGMIEKQKRLIYIPKDE